MTNLMAREYDEYRFVLADLKERFEDRSFIGCSELAKAEGCDVRTVKRRYGIPYGQRGIDRAVLARRKCELAHLK